MDVIAAWQAGIKTGLLLGTSLTAQQINKWKLTKELVFDWRQRGFEAAIEGLNCFGKTIALSVVVVFRA